MGRGEEIVRSGGWGGGQDGIVGSGGWGGGQEGVVGSGGWGGGRGGGREWRMGRGERG